MPGITRDAGTDTAQLTNINWQWSELIETELANNKPVVRIGDRIKPHGKHKHRHAKMVTGSGSVYTNNKKTCRQGDKASCGHHATGSANTFVN